MGAAVFSWRDGLMGAFLGVLIGALCWAWWPSSFPVPAAVAYGSGTGLILGLFNRTRVADWLGDLFASLW